VRRRPRAFVSAFGAPGHVFPAMALARALDERGYEIWFETRERWRDAVEDVGFRFVPAPDYIAFPGPRPGMPPTPTLAECARAFREVAREVRPQVVINDVFTLPAALAAELDGVPCATTIHHPYPVNEPGLPYFMVGLLPPRTPLGAAAWRAAKPWFARRAGRQRRELNAARAELGLRPLQRLYGSISDELALVANFPQLEYPRRWPPHVHITGPMLFELSDQDSEPPEGDGPLIVAAGSTAQDHGLELVRTALEALADEPVRVLAVLAGKDRSWAGPTPANAKVVNWASYSRVMPHASLVVCNGGLGTVAMALSAGVPVIVRPAGADMGENGARVAWAGVGLMLPRGVFGRHSLRVAVRRVLADGRFASRARELAEWSHRNDGAARGAALVDRHLG
jgi:UDP:flavonoid glycosyltransferase YjiC (YdhE family)